jgi:F-type H+-transporting ATPase subunit gamma
MKMVAAAKMKQDLGRLERAKGFGVGSMQRVFEDEPYVQKKKATINVKKTMLVPFTTDKGLCGGTNSSIIREVKAMVKQDRGAYRIFVVGDKGSLALTRTAPDLIENTITNLITPMNFPTAASIANTILGIDCDRVVLLYNEFKNVITQIQRKVEIMPRKQFLKQFKLVVKHDTSEP